jgi:hypothetical protein
MERPKRPKECAVCTCRPCVCDEVRKRGLEPEEWLAGGRFPDEGDEEYEDRQDALDLHFLKRSERQRRTNQGASGM